MNLLSTLSLPIKGKIYADLNAVCGALVSNPGLHSPAEDSIYDHFAGQKNYKAWLKARATLKKNLAFQQYRKNEGHEINNDAFLMSFGRHPKEKQRKLVDRLSDEIGRSKAVIPKGQIVLCGTSLTAAKHYLNGGNWRTFLSTTLLPSVALRFAHKYPVRDRCIIEFTLGRNTNAIFLS